MWIPLCPEILSELGLEPRGEQKQLLALKEPNPVLGWWRMEESLFVGSAE